MNRAFYFAMTFILSVLIASPASAQFGDFKSVTLTTKAWQMLNKGEYEKVRVFTQKCIALYGDQAKTMQDSLDNYPIGDKKEIFSYWALNDVATSLFIEGKSLIEQENYKEAKVVLEKLINEFTYGQCWDPSWQGFWKPAEAAQELFDNLE